MVLLKFPHIHSLAILLGIHVQFVAIQYPPIIYVNERAKH